VVASLLASKPFMFLPQVAVALFVLLPPPAGFGAAILSTGGCWAESEARRENVDQ
jgi:hypothetical protein